MKNTTLLAIMVFWVGVALLVGFNAGKKIGYESGLLDAGNAVLFTPISKEWLGSESMWFKSGIHATRDAIYDEIVKLIEVQK